MGQPQVLLIAIVLPFNHTLLWLYVLPLPVLTWLTTRPVIESKRLPDLVESQARYLTEPRAWVRLVPLSEKDRHAAVRDMSVVGPHSGRWYVKDIRASTQPMGTQ